MTVRLRAALAVLGLALFGAACADSEDETGSGRQSESARPTSPAPAAVVARIPSLFDAQPRQADGTHVGRVEGSEAFIAVVAQGGEAAVYVCDGKTGEWFGGRLSGDRLDLRTERGTELKATVTADRVSGTLTFGPGPARNFTATPPSGPGPGIFAATGLFRTTENVGGRDYVTGWIILPEGIRGTKTNTAEGFTLTKTTNPGETLRSQLPGPNQARPRSQLAFVGQDANRVFRVSLVRDTTTNGAVAFVSNGVDVGVWLTGAFSADDARLSAPDGSNLAATVSGGRGSARGTIAGRNLTFGLEQAGDKAGLFREVQAATDGRQVEIGDIVLNDGAVVGLASSSGATYFSFTVEASEPSTSDGRVVDSTGASPSGPQPTLMAKWRCALLYLRGAKLSADGLSPDEKDRYAELQNRYKAGVCSEHYGVFP